MECNKKTIWCFKQNKPSLVVEDIVAKYPNVDPDFIYQVLLQRGVFKWLSVRRDLIKLKNTMRKKISKLNRKKTLEERGYYKALLNTRASIRKLCHSERWVAPDYDRKANEYLNNLSKNNINL